MFGIYCVTAALVGLLIATGDAAAGGLWVANANSPTLAEFQGGLKSGSKPPSILLNDSNDLDGSSTIAFHNGNLWVTNFNSNTIVEFTQPQVSRKKKHPADPTVVVTISEDGGSNLAGPEGLVFDTSGNMWVGAEDGKEILEYTPAQYAVSGNPTPNAILNANSFNFSSPSHLAFDAAGNLWVVDEDISNGNGGNGEVFKYSKAQITGLAAGTSNIDPVFGIALSEFAHLETLAFDGSGNMWLADQNGDNIYKFSANQLTGTGLSQDLTAAVVLSPTHHAGGCRASIDGPYGVAVDGAGNLYVSNANVGGQCSGSLAEFSADKILSTGSPKPKVFITTDGQHTSINSPNALTFGP
jgi:sugar lactone lactonase YvrE